MCAKTRQAQGRAAALAPSPVRRARVHAEVMGDPRHGRAVRCRGLHPRSRPAGVGAAGSAAAGVGPRVGRHRAGAVARGVSICRGALLWVRYAGFTC